MAGVCRIFKEVMSRHATPLWIPGPDLISGSRLHGFLEWLRAERSLSFTTYEECRQWSVSHMAEFWEAIWDHFNIMAHDPFEQVMVLPARNDRMVLLRAKSFRASLVRPRAEAASSSDRMAMNRFPMVRNNGGPLLQGATPNSTPGVKRGKKYQRRFPNLTGTVSAVMRAESWRARRF